MALIGSAPTLRCSCGGTLIVGKDVQPLQSVKPIRTCPRYWTSHGVVTKLVFGFGMFPWRKLFLEKCVAVCLGYSGRGVW
jgi:hypothetical protein